MENSITKTAISRLVMMSIKNARNLQNMGFRRFNQNYCDFILNALVTKYVFARITQILPWNSPRETPVKQGL